MAKSILALNIMMACLIAVYLANQVEATLCTSSADCSAGECCTFLFTKNGKGICNGPAKENECCQLVAKENPVYCGCAKGLTCVSTCKESTCGQNGGGVCSLE